jgi:hypothetical protein
VQALDDFRQSLAQYFEIKRSFPTSYNWHHSEPNRKLIKAANRYVSNINLPFIGPVLAVEYFFICFKLSFPAGIATKGRKGSLVSPFQPGYALRSCNTWIARSPVSSPTAGPPRPETPDLGRHQTRPPGCYVRYSSSGKVPSARTDRTLDKPYPPRRRHFFIANR